MFSWQTFSFSCTHTRLNTPSFSTVHTVACSGWKPQLTVQSITTSFTFDFAHRTTKKQPSRRIQPHSRPMNTKLTVVKGSTTALAKALCMSRWRECWSLIQSTMHATSHPTRAQLDGACAYEVLCSIPESPQPSAVCLVAALRMESKLQIGTGMCKCELFDSRALSTNCLQMYPFEHQH